MARSSGYDNAGPLTPVGRVEPKKFCHPATRRLPPEVPSQRLKGKHLLGFRVESVVPVVPRRIEVHIIDIARSRSPVWFQVGQTSNVVIPLEIAVTVYTSCPVVCATQFVKCGRGHRLSLRK
jgi:hypothetical protein